MKNENTIEPGDPRLTAYVVGEMPQAEAATLERELENSPDARKEIERIRETADLLRHEFATELESAFPPKKTGDHDGTPGLSVVRESSQRPSSQRGFVHFLGNHRAAALRSLVHGIHRDEDGRITDRCGGDTAHRTL